jgi:nucleoside-diphosphate-sugar epimerase
MKRVLLTGPAGFIGRHAIPHLQAAEFEVHVVTHWSSIDNDDGTRIHKGNILDERDVRRILEEACPTHLLHLAWYAVPGKFWTSLENLKWVGASLSLLQQFAAIGGGRALFVGSCAEYEWSDEVICDEEHTTTRPSSLYGICKNSLREIVLAAADQLAVRVAWARIFHVYGPHEAPERLVSSVIRSLLNNVPARCTHGLQIRDFMHVDDVARALVTVLDSSYAGTINTASGTGVHISHVVESIAEQLSRRHLLALGAIPASGGEPAKLVANVDRLRALSFRPRFDLPTGIADSIAWWKRNLA